MARQEPLKSDCLGFKGDPGQATSSPLSSISLLNGDNDSTCPKFVLRSKGDGKATGLSLVHTSTLLMLGRMRIAVIMLVAAVH